MKFDIKFPKQDCLKKANNVDKSDQKTQVLVKVLKQRKHFFWNQRKYYRNY